ncbi:Type II secretion system (T2SS), protein F [Arthrobacter sp. VKM Ac-2550]|nr:Type II secretion system (T2SS), protein F [Arthrobacter sp. VKM Ac-2550]
MAGLIIPLLIFGALWLLVGPWPRLRKRRRDRVPAGTSHRFRAVKRQSSDAGASHTGAASGSVGVSAPDTALMLDLLGAMIQSGTSLPAAVATLAQVAEPGSRERLDKVASALQLGTEWHTAWGLVGRDTRLDEIQEALRFGAATGAPSAAILYAQADQLRRRRRQEAERRAATLGTRLVLPLGLCALPSFISLGIVPVLISLLPDL